MLNKDWVGAVARFLSACAHGCYKQFKNGKWVCVTCGK